MEPVFAHICHTLGLDRFTLRGRAKVNSQGQVFCLVHNLERPTGSGPFTPDESPKIRL